MMGMTVADLVAKLGLDSGEFDRGMDGVVGKAGRAEKVLNGVSKAAMAGAVAAGALVVKSLDTYNDFGTAINTLTRLTGMSSQAASKLTGQWQRFGVESQSGINATKFLAKNLDAAQQGSKPLIETFKRLGVSLKEPSGKLRDIGVVLPEVRDKLSEMDNAGQRTALTLKLFGRGGADMLGWLTKTPAQIAKVNKELQGLGMVWGGKQVKDWQALKDAQREMGLQWTALQLNLAQTLLPTMKTLMGYVQTGIKDWNNLSDGTQGFILKATAAAGVLGIIGPKAYGFAKAVWEIAAAVRGVGTAQAVAGAAGAAGGAGGGLLSGVAGNVGANVASAAGVGGAAKGYQAMTAAKMMGGAGITPAAYVAGGIGAGAAAAAAAVAVGFALPIALTFVQAHAVETAKVAQEAAGTTPRRYGRASVANLTIPGADEQPGPAPAGTYKGIIQKLSVKMDGASYGEFQKLYGSIKSIQLLAGKGIVLNMKDLGSKTPVALRNLRTTIMKELGLTAKQATQMMNEIASAMAGKPVHLKFKIAEQTGKELDKTKDTVTSQGGAIAKALIAAGDKSGKGLAAGLNHGQGPTKAAAARLKAGATGAVNPIPGVLGNLGKNASNSLAKGVGNVGPTKGAAGRLAAAAKPNMPSGFPLGASLGQGLVAGMQSTLGSIQNQAGKMADAAAAGIKVTGQIRSPSRVTHKMGMQFAQGLANGMLAGRSNVSAAARGLALAGIPSITGGASRGAANSGGTVIHNHVAVNAPVYGVDDLHSIVYAGTMAAMEEAQVAEGRSLRGSVR